MKTNFFLILFTVFAILIFSSGFSFGIYNFFELFHTPKTISIGISLFFWIVFQLSTIFVIIAFKKNIK